MSGPLFSGALFRHIVEELEKAAGSEEVWRAAGTLPDEARGECLDILAIRWVHAATSTALVRAVARQTRRDARELHNLVVERATERVFTTIWRVIFHFSDPQSMVMRVPIIFNRTYKGLRTEAALDAPGQATIRIRDWADMDELSFEGIGLSIAVALRVAAKHEVAMNRARSSDGAVYKVVWRN